MALVVDTGVLIAAIDAGDRDHVACAELLAGTRERRLIPAPVLVELDHLLRRLHPEAMSRFLGEIVAGAFEVVDLMLEDLVRVRVLLDDYRDLRVGYVDAAVLSIVERSGEAKLATLDRRHFAVMRPRHVDALELLPA